MCPRLALHFLYAPRDAVDGVLLLHKDPEIDILIVMGDGMGSCTSMEGRALFRHVKSRMTNPKGPFRLTARTAGYLFAAVCLLLSATSGALSPAEEEAIPVVVRGNSKFAAGLYQRLAKEPGNVFFSPFNISSALAMTYTGAEGETAQQMARALHFPADGAGIHVAFGALSKQINGKSDDYELSVANAIWGRKGVQFRASFQELLRANYGAELTALDFASQAEEARATINRWVEAKTNDKIKELIRELYPDTQLVLASAIYFKGNWSTPFDKEETQDKPFYTSAGESVQTPMMHALLECPYFEDDHVKALGLPYRGRDLTMMIVLPKVTEHSTVREVAIQFSDFEKSITVDSLATWMDELGNQASGSEQKSVSVQIPRFKADFRFELAGTLSEMGMPLRPFTGMTESGGLNVSKVIHQSFVEVNEEGTEAAAATAVLITKSKPIPRFHADHPFIFIILDRRSDSILFMGRVVDPALGGSQE